MTDVMWGQAQCLRLPDGHQHVLPQSLKLDLKFELSLPHLCCVTLGSYWLSLCLCTRVYRWSQHPGNS